jgi:hypothetical protein
MKGFEKEVTSWKRCEQELAKKGPIGKDVCKK